jgi:glucose/arabinose dehydrogenase
MTRRATRTTLTACLALAAAPALAAVEQGPPNAPFDPAWETQTRAPALDPTPVVAEPFAGPLEHPWGIAALPDGTFLVTERPGRLRVVAADGTLSEPVEGLPGVDARRQGGLLDVALSPDFAADRTLFWTYSKPVGGGLTATAAARGVLSEDGRSLSEVRDIFVQEPPSDSPMHYGSRILVLPDGTLAITTGEHSQAPERERAQDSQATWGKVIRINPDGSIPADNPFADGEGGHPGVWTLGHRNPQGAALDAEGRLWVIEHGARGGDELNRIERGANYGWPVVSYGVEYSGAPIGSGQPRAEGFEEPVYYWDPVIAPAGMAFYGGDLFEGWSGDVLASSLNPGGLVRLRLDEDGLVAGEERLLPELGRVRDVEVLEDGSLLVLTDDPQGGILRVTPG